MELTSFSIVSFSLLHDETFIHKPKTRILIARYCGQHKPNNSGSVTSLLHRVPSDLHQCGIVNRIEAARGPNIDDAKFGCGRSIRKRLAMKATSEYTSHDGRHIPNSIIRIASEIGILSTIFLGERSSLRDILR